MNRLISGKRAGMSEAGFYHALDLASIEALDCDIPLNIGFDVQRYIKADEKTYWWSGPRRRLRLKLVPRLVDSQARMNRHQVSMTPRHINSNSGAGYR